MATADQLRTALSQALSGIRDVGRDFHAGSGSNRDIDTVVTGPVLCARMTI
jgi:hypothetical protein